MCPFLKKALAGSLIYFTSLALAEAPEAPSECCPDGKKHSRSSIRHIEGGGIGYSDGYTTLEAFLAPAPDPELWDLMPFLDVRGHLFDDGKWAANAGAGIRAIFGNRAYGLNAYYDYRETKHAHFNQIGLGLETLGEVWDLRVNGYLPVGEKISKPYGAKFYRFVDHEMLVSRKYQFAMKGADAELGYHFGKSRNFEFYAAAGPYYYIGEIGGNAWGGKGRINCMYKDYITLEISDSYDSMFHNNFQGQLTFSLPFGGKSRVKKRECQSTCKTADALIARMVQPVSREEIIVAGSKRKHATAIDPATGLPLFFVFVNNTSHSDGTYESPYPTLAQAQANSKPGDVIYVFPGDGTTQGMDAGITLQENQKFWGSGVSHLIQTTVGTISIPAQSSDSPTITNTDINTDGNAITLAANNVISGFTIASAMNDAISGIDLQNLEVSSCTFENTTTYAIEAHFPGNASISLTNNQFLNNVNGVLLTLLGTSDGTSTVICSDNTFVGQTSIFSIPLEISAANNILDAEIENNIFNGNTVGSVLIDLNTVPEATINVLNNTATNNGTGSRASLGSSLVIVSNGTIDNCSLVLEGNTFSNNTSNSVYLHTSGAFTNLEITASTNTMSGNGGSALNLATPVDILTLLITDNIITGCGDNGIAVIGSGTTTAGTITINNNTIADITDSVNLPNGIVTNQDFSNLNLTISNNIINRCDGTGILSYASTGIDFLTLNVSGNTITNCVNKNTNNAAAGLAIEQYTTLVGSVTNNTFSGNAGIAVFIGSDLPTPTTCLTLTGNTVIDSSTDYSLSNPVDGLFNLSPCDVDSVNVGIITPTGIITPVQSCPGAAACPP